MLGIRGIIGENKLEKVYIKPGLKNYSLLAQITQMVCEQGVEGIIGIDINGDDGIDTIIINIGLI